MSIQSRSLSQMLQVLLPVSIISFAEMSDFVIQFDFELRKADINERWHTGGFLISLVHDYPDLNFGSDVKAYRNTSTRNPGRNGQPKALVCV